MPHAAIGDRIRDDFERMARRKAATHLNLALAPFGQYFRPASGPPPPWGDYGKHPFSNVKDNNLFRFVHKSTREPKDLSAATPCAQGCTWLYVAARSTTAPWGVDRRRFRELDENFQKNHEEGWLVLLDRSPVRGFVVCRAMLDSVVGPARRGSDQALVKDADIGEDSYFDGLTHLFDRVIVRPPSVIPHATVPPPPPGRCPKHGMMWVRRQSAWICPACARSEGA